MLTSVDIICDKIHTHLGHYIKTVISKEGEYD